jgi:VanZ family protein
VFLLAIVPLSDSINRELKDSFFFQQLRLDHLFHGIIFMSLHSVLFVNLRKSNAKAPAWVALIFGAIFSLVVELIQIPIVYRSFTLYDLMANFIGFIIGTMLFILETSLLRNSGIRMNYNN